MKYLLYCLGHEYDHSNTENLEVELLCVEDFSVGKRGSLLFGDIASSSSMVSSRALYRLMIKLKSA